MPESEPKPKLIELAGPGAGQGWKVVLKSGKPAVVHEIPVPPAEAQAATPRLQRLFEHRHPALSPVLAWGTDANGLWVAVEPNEGTPLSTILQRGPLTPPAAAALGAAVLSGVAALHEAGIAMGGFGATAVRVTTNGDVRLAGHPAAAVRAAPSQSDLRADVRSCGMAVCAAFGVDPAGAPAPPNISPGLVVTMRSMASGAMGPSADRAMGALREMAAVLLSPDRGMAAQSELATRAGGREVPAITPFLPPGTVPPEPRPSAPAPSYITPPRREETPAPRQSASYEAPDRPVQTYPAMPAITFPPTPAPVEPPEPPKPSPPPVPTWAEGPAAAPEVPAPPAPPAEPAAPSKQLPWEPAASVTSPTSAAPVEPPKPPPAPEPPPAVAEPPRPVPTWDAPPSAPAPAPAPAFSTTPPAAATNPPVSATNPPAPAPVAPSRPPAQQTWSPVETPVWTPGEAIPAEPLGTGYASADAPPRAPTTPPPITRPPISAPAPKPVPRPRRDTGGGGAFERPPWLVPAAIAVAIVLLLGIFGVIVLANRNNNPVGQTHTTPTPHTSATPKGSPSPSAGGAARDVPTVASASDGQVKKVQFCTVKDPCPFTGDTDTSCAINSDCTVDFGVLFTSTYAGQWSVDIMYFDRCTGQAPTTLLHHADGTPSKGVLLAEPGTLQKVQLPSGAKSAALFVVTRAPTPGVAQSAPLLLGSDTC